MAIINQSSALNILKFDDTTGTLIVQSPTNNSNDIQQWKNSSGTILISINAYGDLYLPWNTIYSSAVSLNYLNNIAGTNAYIALSNGNIQVINRTTASNNLLIVKGMASQTGDLQEWQDSAGTILSRISSSGMGFVPGLRDLLDGGAYLNMQSGTSGILINTRVASNKGLVIQGTSSQTANLQEWQDNSGTVLSKITSTGMLEIIPSSGSTIQFKNSSGVLTFWGGNSSYYMNTGLYMTGGSWADGRLAVDTQGASNKGIVVRGAASQTASLQEWQNSTGTVLAKVASDGSFVSAQAITAFGGFVTNNVSGFGGYTLGAGNAIVGISTALTNYVGIIVRAVASQTANLQEWQNSNGTVLAKIDSAGNFNAVSKSFDIPHPTKENMRLRYGSLEGPENGVYVRGRSKENIIELPEYWTELVNESTITINITPIGSNQDIYINTIENNKVYLGGEIKEYFFTIYGERKDIERLMVEY